MGLVSQTPNTLGDLAGALEFVLDRAALETVVKDLNTSIDDLEVQAGKLSNVSDSAFGGSTAGAFVHQHSTMAYDAVMDALGALNTGMQHYIGALQTLEQDTDEADQLSAAVTAKINAGIESTHLGSGDPGTAG